jgi:hypothetical protein
VLTMVTPPALEPVSLTTAKLHCRVDFDDDDAYITALVTAARQKCESYLTRSFVTTAWAQTLDGFPGQFSRFSPALGTFAQGSYGYGMGALYGYIPERLLAGTSEPVIVPKARLIAVQSVTYLDPTSLSRVTLDPSLYSVEPGDGGRISPAYNHSWPLGLVYPGSVVISLTMGYGPNAADTPATVVQAMLLCLGHWYRNREAVSEASMQELPMGAKWLLASEDWGNRP